MASPRQRAARWRYVQYAVLVVVLLAIALIADWEQIQRAFWDWELVKEQFPDVITIALKNTIIYTACGFTFGLALGLVLALMRLSSVGPYRWIATGIIELFRGLPALVVFIALSVGFNLAFPATRSPSATSASSPSPSAWSAAPTWPRPSGPASRRCRRGRWRLRGRSACRTAGR